MSLLFRKSSDPPAVFPTYLLPSLPFRRTSSSSRHLSADSNASSSSYFSNHSSNSTSSGQTTSTHRTSIDSVASPSSNPFSRCPTPVHDENPEPPADKYLHGHTSNIECASCATDLALTSQIISKGFTGRHGRAYLVQGHPSSRYTSTLHTTGRNGALPNTFLSKPIPRSLVTGQHMVADVSCSICGSLLGWKYVEASEESQKYKVGKFILETKKIRVGSRWDNEPGTGFGHTSMDSDYDEVVPVSSKDLQRMERTTMGSGITLNSERIEFDSQDEDECEDLFAGVWSPGLARRRRQRKSERFRRKAGKVYVPRGSQESLSGSGR